MAHPSKIPLEEEPGSHRAPAGGGLKEERWQVSTQGNFRENSWISYPPRRVETEAYQEPAEEPVGEGGRFSSKR